MSVPTDSEEPLRNTTLVLEVPVFSLTVTTIWSPAARMAPHAEFFVSQTSFQVIAEPSAFSNRVRLSPVVKAVTGIASNSAEIVISPEFISTDVSAVADFKDSGLVHFENWYPSAGSAFKVSVFFSPTLSPEFTEDSPIFTLIVPFSGVEIVSVGSLWVASLLIVAAVSILISQQV